MDSTQTQNEQLWRIELRAVGAGGLGGLVAGIAMGIIFQLGTEVLPVLGAFAGKTTVQRGWIVHLLISITYGTLFAIIAGYPPVQRFLEDFDAFEYVLVGIVYATMVAALSIAILPFVFRLPWVTPAARGPFPNIPGPVFGSLLQATMFGLGHLVYGAILGSIYVSIGETPD